MEELPREERVRLITDYGKNMLNEIEYAREKLKQIEINVKNHLKQKPELRLWGYHMTYIGEKLKRVVAAMETIEYYGNLARYPQGMMPATETIEEERVAGVQ